MEKVIWIGIKRPHMKFHSQKPEVRERIANIEVGDSFGDGDIKLERIRNNGEILGIGAKITDLSQRDRVENQVLTLFRELEISVPPQTYEDFVTA